MEIPYKNMAEMLDDLEEALMDCIKGPYALWGHSMGGKIAYEIEKRLERSGKQSRCLFISGGRIPSIPEPKPIYQLSDDAFKRALGRFEGTPEEILVNQELLDFFLPMLQAEFTSRTPYRKLKFFSYSYPAFLISELFNLLQFLQQWITSKIISH